MSEYLWTTSFHFIIKYDVLCIKSISVFRALWIFNQLFINIKWQKFVKASLKLISFHIHFLNVPFRSNVSNYTIILKYYYIAHEDFGFW